MRTSGAPYRQPEANPPGRLSAAHGTAPSSRSQSAGFWAVTRVLAGGAPAGGVLAGGASAGGVLAGGVLVGGVPRVASTPVAIRTPVAGFAANSRSWARVTRAHRAVRGLSSTRCGPQIAPATEEVVSAGGVAARMVTRSPASARHTAVVSPETPAPTTRTSQSLLGTAPTVPCARGAADSETEARGRMRAPTLNYGRARGSHPTAANTPPGASAPATAAAGAALAGGARPAAACPPPGSAGEAFGDGRPGRDIAAVLVRGRARAQ